MDKLLLAAVALAALSLITLADVGPGPDPATLPYVVLNTTLDGQPIPDGTTAEVYCIINGEDVGMPTAYFSCEGGICRNPSWYKLSPCVREENASAVFEFETSSGKINTSALPVRGGFTYYYDVSLNSDGSYSATQTGASENPRSPQLCPLFLAFPLLFIAGTRLRR